MLSQIILIGCIIFGSPLLLVTFSSWRYYRKQDRGIFALSICLLSIIFIVYSFLIFKYAEDFLPGWNSGPIFMFGMVAFFITMMFNIFLLYAGYKKGK
jgi:hypothetical protein